APGRFPLLVTIFDDLRRRTVLPFRWRKIRPRRRALTVESDARRTAREGALTASRPLLSYAHVLRSFGERYASRQSSSSSRFCSRSYLGSHDVLSAPVRTQGARRKHALNFNGGSYSDHQNAESKTIRYRPCAHRGARRLLWPCAGRQ